MPQSTLFYDEIAPQPRTVSVQEIIKPPNQKISPQLRKQVERYRRIIVPVVLQETSNSHGQYIIKEGKKRVLLAIELGIDEVPAVVFGKDDLVPENLGVMLNETHKGNRHDTISSVYHLFLDEEKEAPEIARMLGITKAQAEQYIREVSQHPELVSEYLAGRLSTSIFKMLLRRSPEEQRMAASLLEAQGHLNKDDVDGIKRAAAVERDRRSPSMFSMPEMGDFPYVRQAQSCGDGVIVIVTKDGQDTQIRIPVDKILEYI